MINEKKLIEQLLFDELSNENKKIITVDFVMNNYEKLSKKSLWVLNKLISMGVNFNKIENFRANFYRSWVLYYLNASSVNKQACQINFNHDTPTLYLTFHFPKYPLLMNFANTHDLLIIVANDSIWMSHFIENKSNLYNFRAKKLSSKLPDAFRKKKSILAMFDYCYESSRYITSNFLGINVKSPYAILLLAKRFNYKIKFLSYSNGFNADTCSFENISMLTQDINNLISEEIYNHPSNWLLWASLDTRWLLNDENIYE